MCHIAGIEKGFTGPSRRSILRERLTGRFFAVDSVLAMIVRWKWMSGLKRVMSHVTTVNAARLVAVGN